MLFCKTASLEVYLAVQGLKTLGKLTFKPRKSYYFGLNRKCNFFVASSIAEEKLPENIGAGGAAASTSAIEHSSKPAFYS
jgi:hypothetical protein